MNEREIDEIDNEEYMLNEMYTGPSQTTEMYTVENNNSKGKNGLILFLIFTTLLFGGLFTYYFFVSTKCKETTKEEINFDKLTSSPAFEQWLLHGNTDIWANRNFNKISRIVEADKFLTNKNRQIKNAKYSAAVTNYNPDPNVPPFQGEYDINN